jgi:hypothetical protein
MLPRMHGRRGRERRRRTGGTAVVVDDDGTSTKEGAPMEMGQDAIVGCEFRVVLLADFKSELWHLYFY